MERGWLKKELEAAKREVASWPEEKREQTPAARWRRANGIPAPSDTASGKVR